MDRSVFAYTPKTRTGDFRSYSITFLDGPILNGHIFGCVCAGKVYISSKEEEFDFKSDCLREVTQEEAEADPESSYFIFSKHATTTCSTGTNVKLLMRMLTDHVTGMDAKMERLLKKTKGFREVVLGNVLSMVDEKNLHCDEIRDFSRKAVVLLTEYGREDYIATFGIVVNRTTKKVSTSYALHYKASAFDIVGFLCYLNENIVSSAEDILEVHFYFYGVYVCRRFIREENGIKWCFLIGENIMDFVDKDVSLSVQQNIILREK